MQVIYVEIYILKYTEKIKKNKYKNKEIKKKIILKLLVLNKTNLYFNYKKNIYIIVKNINNVI